nr:peptidylprolyl isomerase [Mariprofundus ferrooxydans]
MAKHILVKTKAEAEALKVRLAGGADFAALARKYSLCPSKKRGGDLGEIYPGQLVRPIENVIFKQPLLKLARAGKVAVRISPGDCLLQKLKGG